MSQLLNNIQRVLAIDPYHRGFGFAVIEEPFQLVGFGLKIPATKKGNDNGYLKKIESIIDYYRPDVLVLEDRQAKECRRRRQSKTVLRVIEKLASHRSVRYVTLSWPVVHHTVASQDTSTKYAVAVEISRRFPELKSYLPRQRKVWMSEDETMNIFDATALAVTFFYFEQRQNRSLKNL